MKQNGKTKTPMKAPGSENNKLPPAAMAGILCAAAVAAIFLVLFAGRYSIRCLYHDNRSFLLTDVKIDCTSPVVRQMAAAALEKNGVVPGQTTLPKANVAAVRDELKDDPRIADVTVTRHYPDQIAVNLVERIPVAILRFHPRYHKPELKIDQDGIVLPNDAQGVTQVLPTINGLDSPENFVPGQRTSNMGVLAFLSFLKESQLRPDGSMYEVTICRLDAKKETLNLYLEANGPFKRSSLMVLPMNDISTSLDRLRVVVSLRQENNQTISYINATYENIPVKQ